MTRDLAERIQTKHLKKTAFILSGQVDISKQTLHPISVYRGCVPWRSDPPTPDSLHATHSKPLQAACVTLEAYKVKMTQNETVTTGTLAGRASYPRGRASVPSLSDSPPQAHNGMDAICDHVYCFM